MTESRWRQVAGWGLGVVLGGLFLQAARLALHKAFSIDEFQYAHAAWLMAHGQVPYRDFFEVHFPLVYQALAPLFWVLGDDPRAVLGLRAAMLVPLAGTCVAAFVLNRREGRLAALLAPVLLLGTVPFVRFATEIRPDAVAIALFLGALASLAASSSVERAVTGTLTPTLSQRERGSASWASFFSGMLLVAAVWGSQKVIFHGGLVGAVLAVDLGVRRGRGPSLVPAPRAFLLGLGVAVAAVATYLTVTHSWAAWWQWCFVWASEHQRHYPGFSWRDYLLPAVREQPWLFTLAALGLAATAHRLATSGHARWSDPDLLLVLAVPATFGSYALQRAPFPYSLLPFLGVLAPFAARGAAVVLGGLRAPAVRAVGVALGVVLLGAQAWRLEQLLEDGGNARQREVLARIATLTGPEDVVYDNSGGYVSRPHAHFYFYTDAYLRGSIAGLLAHELPQTLVARGCVLRVDDLRTSGLPAELRRFLADHYQPLDGDLFLWGQRYDVADPAGLESRFLAVRDDRYFVEPARVLDMGTLFIDGARVTSAELTLSRGEHTVRYTGPPGQFHLLWLPRDGKHWTPRPEAPATYSRLF